MENFEATHTAHDGSNFDTKIIWRTFWILLVITCVELIIGMFIAPHFHPLKHWFNILYIIFTCAKAFYIIAEFMHLGHEIKNMVMTIALPCLLFVWFITAFLWDGNSYRDLRNRYDRYYKESSTEKVQPSNEAKPEHHGEGEKPSHLE